MSTTQEKKMLMVVVTRAYVAANSIDDEFVHEWGFDARRDSGDWNRYVWSDEHPRVLLLVIHGCTEVNPADAITFAIEQNRDALVDADLSTVWLFHHSLKDKDKQKSVEKAVGGVVVGAGQPRSFAYNSEGRAAVDGLTRIFEEGESKNEHDDSLRKAVEAAATGRRIFAGKLHELRSRLLRMRLLFDADAAQEFERVATEHRSETDILLGHRRWHDWLQALKGKEGSGPVADAIKQLRCLAFPSEIGKLPISQRPHEEWNEYCAEGWTKTRPTNAKRIHDDFARFARATDVIIDALEDLPIKPGVGQ